MERTRRQQNIEDRRGCRAAGWPSAAVIGGLVLLLLISALTGTEPADLINTVGPSTETVGTGRRCPPTTRRPSSCGRPRGHRRRPGDGSSRESREGYEAAGARAVHRTPRNRRAASGSRRWARSTAPADRKVYLDLSFFHELDERFGAPGRLRAGLCRRPRDRPSRADADGPFGSRCSAARQRAGEREANALSVRQELQADCYAGVWGHYAAQRRTARTRRRRRRAASRGGDRRRPAAAAVAGTRGPRVVHARIVGAARRWLRRGLESGSSMRATRSQIAVHEHRRACHFGPGSDSEDQSALASRAFGVGLSDPYKIEPVLRSRSRQLNPGATGGVQLMRIGIPAEIYPGETRVAATPETVKKFTAGGRHTVIVETGAGAGASIPDASFTAAGATHRLRRRRLQPAGHRPEGARARGRGAAAAAPRLDPHRPAVSARGLSTRSRRPASPPSPWSCCRASRARRPWTCCRRRPTSPATKRCSSRPYEYGRFMPMLMTAAGTVKAARVLVLGAGVAGLQAIATAKRLGAVIEAFDVRPGGEGAGGVARRQVRRGRALGRRDARPGERRRLRARDERRLQAPPGRAHRTSAPRPRTSSSPRRSSPAGRRRCS